MFDGDAATGPVPILFATNPEAAAAIEAKPAKAHFDLSKVYYNSEISIVCLCTLQSVKYHV
jgi:hypothetical protein